MALVPREAAHAPGHIPASSPLSGPTAALPTPWLGAGGGGSQASQDFLVTLPPISPEGGFANSSEAAARPQPGPMFHLCPPGDVVWQPGHFLHQLGVCWPLRFSALNNKTLRSPCRWTCTVLAMSHCLGWAGCTGVYSCSLCTSLCTLIYNSLRISTSHKHKT